MRERLEPTQQTVQRTLVNGRAHIEKRFQKFRKVTILASFESPLARQKPSVSALNKLRSLEAHGSGGMLRCGIRGPVGVPPGLLTSTASPVLTRLMSGGGRNDLPGSWGNLGAAWAGSRRGAGPACVGPEALVTWVVLLVLVLLLVGLCSIIR